MWSDENDNIEKIYEDFYDIKNFPAECPVCGRKAAHLYAHIYDAKTRKGGLWVWCSDCKSFSHGSIKVPDFWKNCPIIELEKLCAVPIYLEEMKESIDAYVNMIKENNI